MKPRTLLPILVLIWAAQSPAQQMVDPNAAAAQSSKIISAVVEKLKALPEVHDKVLVIRDVAELGRTGANVGPALMQYLDGSDWELRLAAARAVGFIRYKKAKGKLVQLLENEEDWRLVLSAAESLGRLQSAEAVPSLEKVSKDYWYPPVRDTAARALEAIQNKQPFKASYEDDGNVPSVFFGYESIGLDPESFKLMKEEDPGQIRFPVADTSKDAVAVFIKENGPEPQKVIRRGVRAEVNGMARYIVGSDNGEFGGSIDVLDHWGNLQMLTDANTEAIYKVGDEIFAVTGLAHMCMNNGIIYKITHTPPTAAEKDQWKVNPWRVLPGAPHFSRLLQNGDLLVRCYGGIVLISPDGTMKSLTRAEVFKAPGE